MKQGEVKDWLIVAKTAIGKGDFDCFFETLPHLDKEYITLIQDAIKIAQQQKNLLVLDKIAQCKLKQFSISHRQIIFYDLLKAWVELNALEKANAGSSKI